VALKARLLHPLACESSLGPLDEELDMTTPVPAESGPPRERQARVAAYCQYIHARKCLLSAALKAYPDGWIQLLDATLRTLFIQGQGLRLLDLDPEQAIGQPLHALYPETLLQALKEGCARALAGTAAELEVSMDQRIVHLSVSPADPTGQSATRVILIARDITERKQAEEALKHTSWRLSEAQRFAHVGDWEWDLRTNSIQWSDELYRIMGLEVGSPLPDYQGNLALYPAEDAARLDAAVQMALNHHQPYELELRRNQVRLSVALATDAPPHLLGDTTRLHQILGNIIGNAIKFAQSGRVRVEALSLGRGRGKEWVILFLVKDTGLGMAEEQLEALFDPFVQAANLVTQSADGVGLGLSIVKNLVQRMGGSICVGSELGKGTEFAISLPFAEELATATAEEDPARASVAADDKPLDGLHFLGVDDEKTNRLVLSRLLTKQGARVSLAEDGAVALDALQAPDADFDLVLMDIHMPVLDGFATTAAIRRGNAGPRHQGVPILALTSPSIGSDHARFLDAGMQGHVAKPVEIAELTKAIREVLAKPRR
jgi:PAS domain S-box-containing protein